MRPLHRQLRTGLIALLAACGSTLAQDAERPSPVAAPEWKPGPGQLLREGSFLRNRRGRLVRGEGAWVYVFDADAEGNAEPPMVMLPCRRLREMQQSMELQSKTVTFQTTGQVFVYDGRNYLLPTYFGVAATEQVEPAASETTAAGADSRDPKAGDLLREMSARPRPMARTGIAESGSEASAPMREGITIVSRRGRVVRDGGELRFVTDSGPEITDRPEPAMVLMPCMNLGMLENVANRRGERAAVVMSGRVFAYEGRNYLLPTFFVEEIDREGNLTAAP
ncbi:MAG: hypothetical protein JNK58_01470 [Phycisphaerae bacterium]|nr:hypothetical protein [Phycisphaerae bacterium]